MEGLVGWLLVCGWVVETRDDIRRVLNGNKNLIVTIWKAAFENEALSRCLKLHSIKKGIMLCKWWTDLGKDLGFTQLHSTSTKWL